MIFIPLATYHMSPIPTSRVLTGKVMLFSGEAFERDAAIWFVIRFAYVSWLQLFVLEMNDLVWCSTGALLM